MSKAVLVVGGAGALGRGFLRKEAVFSRGLAKPTSVSMYRQQPLTLHITTSRSRLMEF